MDRAWIETPTKITNFFLPIIDGIRYCQFSHAASEKSEENSHEAYWKLSIKFGFK